MANKNIDTLRDFHGTGEPYQSGIVRIPILEQGDALVELGKILAVVYESDRQNQRLTYMHGFSKNSFDGNKELLDCLTRIQQRKGAILDGPSLMVFPDNRTHVFQARFSDRGIIG